ncbi:MAG TPA: cytochrome c maturation protein CcmE [Gammaproteobacteria bacterium]|nr:cytochrome c maturation protein CcmE [Gammaproteobacteria bacterium]
MNPKRKQRLILISAMVIGVVVAVSLILLALNENINHYFDPTQVVAGEAPQDHTFRIGGMVVDGSVQRETGELQVRFGLTDYQKTVTVTYDGILPDLFREGQGVVALGKLQDGVFVAEEVLAKHDENYMPPEVAASLKKDPPQTAN